MSVFFSSNTSPITRSNLCTCIRIKCDTERRVMARKRKQKIKT